MGWIFFLNFLSNVRLRGYRVTNRLNFLSLNFQNEKVTRLPGLQGLQWATRLNLIFFETLEHSSQVTRLQGFEGYMVTELQNPPYILPYLHHQRQSGQRGDFFSALEVFRRLQWSGRRNDSDALPAADVWFVINVSMHCMASAQLMYNTMQYMQGLMTLFHCNVT